MRTATVARRIMELAPADPPDIEDPRYSQIFEHASYIEGTEEHRAKVRRQSAQYRFDYEIADGMFEKFFPDYDVADLFRGAVALDLGCLTGGRTAAWTEQYGFAEAHGFDIDEQYILAAREFAEYKGHGNNRFVVGFGEAMPYEDEMFDVIATFDVIEHVRNVPTVMIEAMRVLKPGGRMFAVFPPYYNPVASHLGLATRMHGLNDVFPGRVLWRAHHDVIARRGPDHAWYNTDGPEPPEYYKSPYLNGITVRRFRNIVAKLGWEIEAWPRRPILTVGQRAKAQPYRTISKMIAPLAKLPLLEEVFLASVSVVLRKPER